MSPLMGIRQLFSRSVRRRVKRPQVVEVLEARVLLTDHTTFDVAYFDVLKGQNFMQTGTGAAVLQGGAPFHLHSSVHAPNGSLTSATLQRPSGSPKTLAGNGSSSYLNLEESFATKTALDTAYPAGNYTATIMHPLSVEFLTALDVSAAAGQPPETITFSSQVVSPNSSGVFHEVWSPQMALVVADGTVTSSRLVANLKGHTNPNLTGSISADWNGSAYVGTYSFNGQNGNVRIPEAIAATLSLPSDAYPNAPHLTNFTALQTVNPAADVTLTWDAFVGGAADDLITLFIFDGNNQVFHTDAIPLPSESPHLNGTATSFVLPKNTLQANKTYQGQLWFQNFTSFDTTSFPGATGATGFYIATNFTIKTGSAVDTSPPDVVAYYVTKAQEFVQTSAGMPVMNSDTPFIFAAFVVERETGAATLDSATITVPSNTAVVGPQSLQSDGVDDWDYFREFDTKTQLDTAFKAGKYTFTIGTVSQGVRSPAVTLPSDAYPTVTPQITNWPDAQLIDTSSDFILNWNAFTGGTSGDFIQVTIVDQTGNEVFETPSFWESNPLAGTARSVVIPGNTLTAGETYKANLLFANASTLDRASYTNAIGTTAYAKVTSFDIGTIPPAGVLQFQASNFPIAEQVESRTATITVKRTGGSQGEVQVQYATSNGTALNGEDYTHTAGTLTFASGVTSQTFEISILDDLQSEGHESVTLQLLTPTNGAILGPQANATLTILDNELTFGPGNFVDSDGDKYTIKLSGPGQALIAIDDPDGVGRGSIKSVLLSDTTTTSSLSVTVTKVTGGDGEVSIGRITGAGSLASLLAPKSDLVGGGISLGGFVGQVTVDDVLNGADLSVGGVPANLTKFTLGDVATGTELRSGATVSTLTAQSFQGDLIHVPAISTLTVNTGSFPAELNVVDAIKTLTLKAGGASGDWLAASFGTVSITGGGFSGNLRSNATISQLGKTAAIASLTITGGDFTGRLNADGLVGTLKLAKNSAGIGGSIQNATLAASGFTQVTVGRDVMNSVILAGARLGADGVISGSGPDADTFSSGKINNFSVTGIVRSSVVGAGLDPQATLLNGIRDNIVGGTASAIPAMSIGGTASEDSYFSAGVFPASVKIAGINVNPRTDARFFTGDPAKLQIIDDGTAGFVLAGQWTTTNAGFQNDSRSSASGSGAGTATWTFRVTPGVYRVSATWPPGLGRATNSTFTVSGRASPLGSATVDQSQPPAGFNDSGTSWTDLGGPYQVFGNTLEVKLTDQANGTVVADAVRVELIGDLSSLPGPASDLAINHLPDLSVPVPKPIDLMVDDRPDGTGLETSRTRIGFLPTATATVSQINAVLQSLQATIVGTIPELSVVIVKIPDSGDWTGLENALETLNSSPAIALATADVAISPAQITALSSASDPQVPGIHTSEAALGREPNPWLWEYPSPLPNNLDGNWGLEAIRAPELWNLNDAARGQTHSVRTAVYDEGFNVLSNGRNGHPDGDLTNLDARVFNEFSGAFVPGGVKATHGEHVAGIIGANFNNGKGIDGLNPFVERHPAPDEHFLGISLRSRGKLVMLADLVRMLNRWPDMKVVNLSLSYELPKSNLEVVGGSPFVTPFGWLFRRIAALHPNTLFVSAAGNDSSGSTTFNGATEVDAKHESAFNWAALAGTPINAGQFPFSVAPVNNIIVVESVDGVVANPNDLPESWIYTRSDFSNVNGHVAAPGGRILSTVGSNLSGSPNYDTFDGTSMAAPYVTALVGYLATLSPSLNVAQIRQLVTGNDYTRETVARDGEVVPAGIDPSAPMIDAFSAVMGIDALLGNTAIQRALVDVDDGSLDGNARIDQDDNNRNGKTDDEFTAILNAGGRRGDGVVDMKDFRTFRDALLQVLAEDASQTSKVALDGRADHPKKDLNGDGRIVTPLTTGSAPRENVYPRYDFNGNGTVELAGSLVEPGAQGIAAFKIDPDTTIDEDTALSDVASLSGIKRDLDVLLGVWDPAAEADVSRDDLLDDLDGNGFVDFLHSADLHFALEKGLTPIDEFDITIEALQDGNVVWDRTIEVDDDWTKTTGTAGETLRRVVTVPLFGQRDVRVTVSTLEGSASETFTALSFGQDRLVKLVAPKFTVADLRRNEGSTDGVTNFKVGITLASAIPGPVTVNYATSDGTAIPGDDYTAVTSGISQFARNALTPATPPTVSVKADKIVESDDTFLLSLHSETAVKSDTATGRVLYFVVPVTATVTIINDDQPAPVTGPAVSISAISSQVIQVGQFSTDYLVTVTGTAAGRVGTEIATTQSSGDFENFTCDRWTAPALTASARRRGSSDLPTTNWTYQFTYRGFHSSPPETITFRVDVVDFLLSVRKFATTSITL